MSRSKSPLSTTFMWFFKNSWNGRKSFISKIASFSRQATDEEFWVRPRIAFDFVGIFVSNEDVVLQVHLCLPDVRVRTLAGPSQVSGHIAMQPNPKLVLGNELCPRKLAHSGVLKGIAQEHEVGADTLAVVLSLERKTDFSNCFKDKEMPPFFFWRKIIPFSHATSSTWWVDCAGKKERTFDHREM